MRALAFVLLFLFISPAAAAEPPPPEVDVLPLVQSELSYLKNPDQLISLRFTEARPADVFATIGDAAGLQVEIVGTFAADTRVSINGDRLTLKACLLQLAEKLDLQYQVRSPTKLLVIVPQQVLKKPPMSS